MNQAATATQSSTTAQRAQWLLSLGCSPLPVAPAQAEPVGKNGKPMFNGKNPSYLDTSGKPHLIRHTQYRDTPPTVAELETWFTNPQNGIGTLAGGGGIDWIDLDLKNFESQSDCDNARAQILERCSRTYFESTRSGGCHIAVRLAEKKDFTNFELGNGGHAGEFLGEGRFVVLAPTPGYTSQNGDEIASVQSAAALGLRKVGSAKTAVDSDADSEVFTPTDEQKQIAEDNKNADMRKAPVALEKLISKKCKDILAAKKSDDASGDLAKLARELYGCAEWYPAQRLPVTGDPDALLQRAATNLGVDSDRLARILQPISRTGNLPGLVQYGGVIKAKAWFRKCRKSEASGDEVCSELKKIQALRKYFDERIRFNELSQKIEIDGGIVEDIESQRIDYIEQENKSIGVDLFCSVARKLAVENSYHPVAIYLEQVAEKSTDTSILDGIAERYFGVSDPLYSIYVKRWLVSAVARIFKPGCKADCALFLQGGQGARKSSFFEYLAGEGFFSDSLGNTQSNADEIAQLHKFWIHEWSELETVFKKKEMATVKSFMARRFDSARFAYRRDSVDLKRRSVFAGTTNESSFLSDNTGDRRFWIIPVRGKIPTDLLKQERDQIWAAAVALYKAGEQWHLTELEEIASGELNAQFRSFDPWHEKIAAFVAGRIFVTVNEILTDPGSGFGFDVKQITRRESFRVSGVLTALGWENKPKRQFGRLVKGWVAPENDLVSEQPEVTKVDPLTEVNPQVEPAQPAKVAPTSEANQEPGIFTPQHKPGDKVVYIGSSFPVLQGAELKVDSLRSGRVICTKPDGRFTTNLDPNELMPEE